MTVAINAFRNQHPATQASEVCLVTALALGVFGFRKSAYALGALGIAAPLIRHTWSSPADSFRQALMAEAVEVATSMNTYNGDRNNPEALATFLFGWATSWSSNFGPRTGRSDFTWSAEAITPDFKNNMKRYAAAASLTLLAYDGQPIDENLKNAVLENPRIQSYITAYHEYRVCQVQYEPNFETAYIVQAIIDASELRDGWNTFCDGWIACFGSDPLPAVIKHDDGTLDLEQWDADVAARCYSED